MSHLDEGTLHALLDGELETHEVAEIQAHLGSCSSCGLRLREVKEFYAEADRLIASVDLAVTAPISAARLTPVPSAPGPQPEQAARRDPTPRPQPAVAPSKWEPWNEPPPVLLVPDNESAAERRMQRMRRLGWAAILLVIVGAGVVEARKFMPMAGEDVPPASNTKMVVSQAEAPARDAGSVTPAPLAKTDSSATSSRTPATTPPAPPRQSKPAAPASSKTLAANALRSTRNEDRKDSAASDEAATDSSSDSATDQLATEQPADSPAGQAENAAADTAGATDLATVRQRAAEALADLDRERRVKQAAAATAALDANKRKTAARVAAPAVVQPAAAPAPPTLEQRAQVYLRIGLDEASRQLGGPAHVIEGLSPLFMGLVQGTSIAGADATRPVVRVVYQDSQGRLILLDQQRLRAGQALPPAGPLSWTIGGTVMWLNGEAGAEILRTYRPRVR